MGSKIKETNFVWLLAARDLRNVPGPAQWPRSNGQGTLAIAKTSQDGAGTSRRMLRI
jgi:hypothetical protein